MPDLIAQGPRPQDRWRMSLPPPNRDVVLGRLAEPWATAWDPRVSRKHASIRWNGSRLEVTKLPEARNAIFFRGQQQEQFSAAVGEHFVIGQTTFTILDQQVEFSQVDVPAFAEQTFSAHLLRQNKYRDADRRIEALGKLPEIISGAANDRELCIRVVNLLLEGVPQAAFVAILRLSNSSLAGSSSSGSGSNHEIATKEQGSASEEKAPPLQILHWDCRSLTGQRFTPSTSLVQNAVQRRESVLHVWNRSVQANPSYTQSENIDWAFCTPVIADACPGWAIYVTGNFAGAFHAEPTSYDSATETMKDDLKFTELTATTMGALRQVRVLQRQQDSLRNFFAPVVLDALAGGEPGDILAPRETDVSVVFCDLRGFSQKSEESADRLLELLQRVSDALGVTTRHVLANGGVVGDFHGDAAMGFWGWPIASERSIEQACLAALAVQQEFAAAARQAGNPLADFKAGLGIASGAAVAGRIGTSDQVKVTVFGPVVNLASRLEGMTKQLQASILMDEVTANWAAENVSPELFRLRRVARVLPYGMHNPLMVSELLPPEGPECILTDEHLADYDEALEQFLAGDWNEAFRLLHRVPAEDQVKDFLTVFIAQHRRLPPPGWDGVIELPSK